MAYEYLVGVDRIITSHGSFLVKSKKKLTEDEALAKGQELAEKGDEPEGDWVESDTTYENAELEDGGDDLKEDE